MAPNIILTNDGQTDGFDILREKGMKTYHFSNDQNLN